jgi:plastocyanin
MPKIRRWLTIGLLPAGVMLFAPTAALALQGRASVTGRITLLERGDRTAPDLDQAVIFLTGEQAPPSSPDTVEMATEGKQFLPRLVVVTRGSTVVFPNHDPFNHNVFSLSPEGPFDLGLYGRGEAKRVEFGRPGVIRVYCNVHAQMRGLVVVQESSLFTQPGSDGSFRLEHVPPGEYLLHAWHERAASEVTRAIRIGPAGVAAGTLTLDARGYRVVQHRDKEGKSYSDRSRRY